MAEVTTLNMRWCMNETVHEPCSCHPLSVKSGIESTVWGTVGMRFAEVSRWAHEKHGLELKQGGWFWYVIADTPRKGTGTPVVYDRRMRRRIAVYARWRKLQGHANAGPRSVLGPVLKAAEFHEDGWLVTSGGRTWWMGDPTDRIDELLAAGFSAVRCGE